MKNLANRNKSFKIIPAIISFALLYVCCDIRTNPTGELSGLTNTLLTSDSLSIGNPLKYKNLQVFPVLSAKIALSEEYITLTQAIEKEWVEVKETGNVNQLSVSNKSDKYVFILAGDIVKGGKQDRTMENDVIIAPHSRNVPLDSYCVESGRWQPRGSEESNKFSENSKVLASKDLKIASRYKKDQSEVWAMVAEKQEKLNRKLSEMEGDEVEIRSAESQTSLQLTLESKELEKYVKEYQSQMKFAENLPENTVGFVYAINNEVYGADIFNNPALFHAVKNKILEAVLIEAIADADSLIILPEITNEQVVEFMQTSDSTKKRSSIINKQTSANEFDAEDKVVFETVNSADSNKWVRRNYVSKSGISEEPLKKEEHNNLENQLQERNIR